MKKIFILVLLLIPFCVFAEDWYSYMNKTHTDILKEFGIPDQISARDGSSVSIYEDSKKTDVSNDVVFTYKEKGVMFFFDDQGNSVTEYGKPLHEFFGEGGILRVCGMYFDNDCTDKLPYDLKIGVKLAEVLENEKLGQPMEYKPEGITYSKTKSDDAEREIKGTRKDSEVNEMVYIYLKEGKVDGVFIMRFHYYYISFR